MKREIATEIAVQGEKEFREAMASANRETRLLASELKVAAAEFEATGDKQAFLTTKSQTLTKQLDQQKTIIAALESAMEGANQKFGAGSKQADDYAIQLNNAKVKAAQMQQELNATEKALNDVDDGMEDATRESRTFGRSLERHVEEEAEDSEKAIHGLGQELLDMKSQLDDIRNMEGVQLGMDLAGGAWDAATALFDYAEQARDYNRQLAMLEVNAANAKIDYSVAETEAFEAASYIGELDSALEGVNNLLAAGLDTTKFVQSVDLLTGAAMRFPDTLKFESLADGLQETLATGQGAGQFAELLERLGVDIDEFNTGLADAKKRGDEVDYTLTYLSQHGLADSKRQFAETNKSMVEAEASTLRLEKAVNSFGEAIDPILTALKNAAAGTLEWASHAVSSETREKLNEEANARLEAAQADGSVSLGEFWQLYTQGIGAAFSETFGGGKSKEPIIYDEALGPAIPETLLTNYETQLQEMEDAATDTGTSIPTDLGAALDEAAPIATASAQSLADEIQTILDSVAVPNYAAMMAAAGGAGMGAFGGIAGGANIILNGRKVGQLMAPTISTMQARAIQG